MVPDELEWVLDMLGFYWPTADEDKLVECAEVWERFAEDVTRLHADADRSAQAALAHNEGESIDAFRTAYAEFQGDTGHLQNAAQAATVIGMALRAAAVVVETCKLAVIAQLVALAIELISAQAAAPFTLGLSELGSMGATASTRMIVRRLLQELRRALVEAIVECMKEPAVSAVEAMVGDLVRQTVNVGFGAQQAYDLGTTAQAGAKGAWAAARQTPQTFLESLRDSMAGQAGGTARDRLDGYLDVNSPFRDGAAPSEPGTGADGGLLGPATKADFASLSADGPGPGHGLDFDAPAPVDDGGDGLLSPGPDAGPVPVSGSDNDGGYPVPAPRGNGPSLPDFDAPAPPGAHGGGPAPGGVPSSAPHPAPEHGGTSIRTEIDSLATHAPTQHATAPTPAPHAPEPSSAAPREDRAGPPAADGRQPATPQHSATPQHRAPVPPAAEGRAPSAPQHRTPAPHAPGSAPRTPGPAPEPPGSGPRGESGAHEPGTRQTTHASSSSTSRGHTVVPAPLVVPRPRRLTGGHGGGPGARWGTASGSGHLPAAGPSAEDGLHGIRADLSHEPGGLGSVDPGDQQALQSAVPRDCDGVPERFPDPFGAWTRLQNDGGHEMPGRSNNSADCSRAFLHTWHGDPQVSAPRAPDADEHGNPDPWAPEAAALANQVRWSGAPHTYAGTGDDPETADRIEQDLLRSGHGAAAIVQVDWPGGGGHAFNAVNHDSTVVWVDTQIGEVSLEPLHLADAEHVWHLPMDPDGCPLYPAQSGAANEPESADEPEPEPSSGPASSEGEPARGPRLP